ncbi:hypothetical protein B0H14DRAFT_2907086 [Mycena olivaceomarginata]|nr:hypothetical protein B0H14DRAFT_2907086 [Mycena olivaceomarginata]
MPKVPSRARKACLRCHDKKIRCDLAPSCDQCEECGRKNIKCTYRDSNTRKRSSPKKELQIVSNTQALDSLKQLVFDLGRRVQSIENAVSCLRTSHHLLDHSAGFGYGGPGGSSDFDQYYQNDPVGPIEAGLSHWDAFISNEWPQKNARGSFGAYYNS